MSGNRYNAQDIFGQLVRSSEEEKCKFLTLKQKLDEVKKNIEENEDLQQINVSLGKLFNNNSEITEIAKKIAELNKDRNNLLRQDENTKGELTNLRQNHRLTKELNNVQEQFNTINGTVKNNATQYKKLMNLIKEELEQRSMENKKSLSGRIKIQLNEIKLKIKKALLLIALYGGLQSLVLLGAICFPGGPLLIGIASSPHAPLWMLAIPTPVLVLIIGAVCCFGMIAFVDAHICNNRKIPTLFENAMESCQDWLNDLNNKLFIRSKDTETLTSAIAKIDDYSKAQYNKIINDEVGKNMLNVFVYMNKKRSDLSLPDDRTTENTIKQRVTNTI